MSEVRPGVNSFFDAYRAAFEAMNATTIADLFTFPLHITGDAGEISITVVETRDEWIEQIDQLLDMYGAIDFSYARILGLASTELTPRLFQAVVHWGLYDRAGNELYDFQALYTLVMIHNSLRIAAISHDEILKYRASLARLKTDRP